MVAYARDKDGLRRNNTVMNFQRRSAARLRSQPPRSMIAPELRIGASQRTAQRAVPSDPVLEVEKETVWIEAGPRI